MKLTADIMISRAAICLLSVTGLLQPLSGTVAADEPAATEEQMQLFEEQIRPILVDRCYRCHSAEQDEPAGGLLLDSRDGIRRGGHSGPAVVPGDVEGSLLMSAIRYGTLEMPPEEKLPDDVIETFRLWIDAGAADTRCSETDGKSSPGTSSETEVTGNPSQTAVTSDGSGPMIVAVGPAWLLAATPGLCWPNGLAGAMFRCP